MLEWGRIRLALEKKSEKTNQENYGPSFLYYHSKEKRLTKQRTKNTETIR